MVTKADKSVMLKRGKRFFEFESGLSERTEEARHSSCTDVLLADMWHIAWTRPLYSDVF